VELYRNGGDILGQLSVVFRTQSVALIEMMNSFFSLWKSIEEAYLAPVMGRRPDYALIEGKFMRTIAAPGRSCSSEELAAAISQYIQLFDSMMKAYLAGRLDAHGIEAAYYSHLVNSALHL